MWKNNVSIRQLWERVSKALYFIFSLPPLTQVGGTGDGAIRGDGTRGEEQRPQMGLLVSAKVHAGQFVHVCSHAATHSESSHTATRRDGFYAARC